MDLYPVKAQFLSGEEVELCLDADGHICEYAEVSIYHLNDLVYRQKVADFIGNILISVGKYDITFAGYGASVTVCTGNTRILLETAFDVVDNPKRSLRYGFLSDFTQDDADNGAVEWLNKCHINMVQYYDWSYRHDHLVTDQEFYTDMMGKPISRETVKDKIKNARSTACILSHTAQFTLPANPFSRSTQIGRCIIPARNPLCSLTCFIS